MCFSKTSPLYSYLPHDALLSPCTFLSSKKKFLYFLSFSDPVQKYIHAFSNTLGFLSLNPTLLPPMQLLADLLCKAGWFSSTSKAWFPLFLFISLLPAVATVYSWLVLLFSHRF